MIALIGRDSIGEKIKCYLLINICKRRYNYLHQLLLHGSVILEKKKQNVIVLEMIIYIYLKVINKGIGLLFSHIFSFIFSIQRISLSADFKKCN